MVLKSIILGERNGNPLQYSCLENPIDRGAWQATVHGVARVGHDLMNKLPQIRNTDSEYRVSFAKGEGPKQRKYWEFGISR